MKKGIHPENYRLVAFKDMSNGTTTITKSTAATKETIEIDGISISKDGNLQHFTPVLYR